MVEVIELGKQIIATKSCTQPTQHGNDLTVLCQDYVDRTFVSVSQKDKVGYVVQAHVQLPYAHAQSYGLPFQSESQREPTVSFVPLFGMPPIGMEDIYALYAKQLALFIYAHSHHPNSTTAGIQDTRKPMVIAIALDRVPSDDGDIDFAAERARLHQIQGMLQECQVW